MLMECQLPMNSHKIQPWAIMEKIMHETVRITNIHFPIVVFLLFSWSFLFYFFYPRDGSRFGKEVGEVTKLGLIYFAFQFLFSFFLSIIRIQNYYLVLTLLSIFSGLYSKQNKQLKNTTKLILVVFNCLLYIH